MAYKELLFSPTGGTKKAADAFMGVWSDCVDVVDLSVPDFKGSAVSFDRGDAALIAMPCFGGRVPKVAVDRLKGVAGNGAPCVVMCVYGNRAFEDGLVEMADAAKDAGFAVVAGIAAIAQHSIMPQYAAERPDAVDLEHLQEYATITKKLIEKGEDASGALPGNRPYKEAGAVPLVPSADKTCTKCGTCAKRCPVSAIDPSTFKADKKACISCMRCIDVCPAHARSVNKLMVTMAAKAIKKAAEVRKEAELFA
ncbi:4Fe-4S ferredoxin [Eggerthellaceae bacterium zg-893]|nr:4Fe-4S ferredoxin [Eggerthellaceae bacterium zg-893]